MTLKQFGNWYEELPVLCYGELDDHELFDYFQTILQWKADQLFISDTIPNDQFTVLEYWLLLGLLSDCIDYGSSPRGGWLTDFGKELLQFIKDGKHLEYHIFQD